MRMASSIVVAALAAALVAVPAAQSGPDRDAAWSAFLAWFRASPLYENPLGEYAGKLRRDGLSEGDVKGRIALVMGQLPERTDWIEPYFDRVYSRKLTGDPEIDRLTTTPSEWLIQSIRGLPPGTALDAGMGQGRNAVYLAQQGWAVTGFDLSGAALAVTAANAAKGGVRVTGVKAGYDTFDFGTSRWDLIVLAFAWAPVADPAFVAKLHASLRPGGRVVYEHLLQDGSPVPNFARKPKPNELRGCFSGFQIAAYEELVGFGDWGGPDSSLVRMVAVKR